MSHVPSLTPELTLPVAVVLPATIALLVHSRRLAYLRGPGGIPAQGRAVLLAVIAMATQEEDLPARAIDDAKGWHGLVGPRRTGQPTESVRRNIRRPRAA